MLDCIFITTYNNYGDHFVRGEAKRTRSVNHNVRSEILVQDGGVVMILLRSVGYLLFRLSTSDMKLKLVFFISSLNRQTALDKKTKKIYD